MADVHSAVPDLRDIPLGALVSVRPAALDRALQRVIPDNPVPPVPVAAFNSALL